MGASVHHLNNCLHPSGCQIVMEAKSNAKDLANL
ncbi:hypothetical protein SAMN05444921_11247 [Streptomyces wuyuanensis]|uniref:Uncharacterized protein n=1 Tax=Streptomyces wuyuanensis TaxID=1196353 RepID=A0A1G9VDL3_9ACTN|nr:hypothetical protein SAMN05444921_11247 [Streptomyces wuyuanensis]